MSRSHWDNSSNMDPSNVHHTNLDRWSMEEPMAPTVEFFGTHRDPRYREYLEKKAIAGARQHKGFHQATRLEILHIPGEGVPDPSYLQVRALYSYKDHPGAVQGALLIANTLDYSAWLKKNEPRE